MLDPDAYNVVPDRFDGRDQVDVRLPADCEGCHCCPERGCEPDEPLGPGVCGHTCPCHPDYYREDGDG